MKEGIYLYGIIKTSDPQEFGAIGIGDKAATDVLTIGYKELAAVVSHSPWMVYDSLKKEKVVKDLAVHQFVIEKVMQQFTILPVRFGTMVETQAEILTFLEKSYALLNDELSKMAGKIELDVVAWCELPTILAAITRDNNQLQAKQQELARKGSQVSIEEKISFGQSVEQALQAEKARYHQLMVQTLKDEAEDMSLHDLASDKMILNAAFLLEKRNEQSFYAAIDTLDQQLESNVNFRVVGPLPPYNFSTILFKKIKPESIEEAKEILGVTGAITDKTLHDAYRQRVKVYHPDTSSAEDSAEFQLVHAAYATLQDFIEHGLIHAEVYRWKKGDQEEK